jgi:thiol-disulfide isomerase/thioredoxin/uncharacterized membrane protein YphA (DoxX/SURF4 family)
LSGSGDIYINNLRATYSVDEVRQMELGLFAIRLILSSVFLVAGLFKLLDVEGSRKAIIDFGLPSWAANPFGIGLPVVEIIAALLLVPAKTANIGAVGALTLLLTFSLAIAINVALGRQPDCHCFGQIRSKPIGWGTLARNLLLVLLASFLVLGGRISHPVGFHSITNRVSSQQFMVGISAVATVAAFTALFWLVLHLFRQNGRLLLRIETLEMGRSMPQQRTPAVPIFRGLPVGSKAVPFDLPKIGGGNASLDGFLSGGKPLLLISTDPKCGPCNAFMPEIASWQKTIAEEINVVLLSRGTHEENRHKVAEFGLANVLVEKDPKVAEKYHALGTPTAVLIRDDGTIGTPAIAGAEGIRQLISSKVWSDAGLAQFLKANDQTPPPSKPALTLGSAPPRFELLDLNGSTVNSAEFNGNGTMVVFWNPACGFCQEMLPQLKNWEQSSSQNAPRLVLVSTGSSETNRAMGLRSTILTDDGFNIGRQYGASGTPSGLLIGADGKVAAELVVGEQGIMQVLTRRN